jgi:hypothetical protein
MSNHAEHLELMQVGTMPSATFTFRDYSTVECKHRHSLAGAVRYESFIMHFKKKNLLHNLPYTSVHLRRRHVLLHDAVGLEDSVIHVQEDARIETKSERLWR